MTSSHVQILRAGPVQPIGLPSFAAMGVTNARVLHRRMLNNNSHAINGNNTISLMGAKRCLFGAPERGEIQNLYKEEMDRNRNRFIQRYNYDIFADRFVSEDKPRDVSVLGDKSTNCNKKCENVENRLCDVQSESKLNKNLISCKNDCDIECNLDKIQLLSITEDRSDKTASSSAKLTASLIDGPSTSFLHFRDKRSYDRVKPYSRQNLITEYYNARKSVNLTSVTNAIEVTQLPKPQRAILHQQERRFQQCEDV